MRILEKKYSEHESMFAFGFLITYVIFSYMVLYLLKFLTSADQITRYNLNIYLWVHILPVLAIILMIKLTGKSLDTIGLKKHYLPWLIFSISVLGYFHLVVGNTPLGIQIVTVLISEEIIFRGYASDRLKCTYGYLGSMLISGVILGLSYSLVPIVNNGISGSELVLYITLGITTQIILQYLYNQYNNILLPIILHASIFTLIL